MRILILHSRYRSGPASGENRVVEDEAELLRQAGHLVEVWDPEPDPGSVASRVRLGLAAVWSTSAAAGVRALLKQHNPEVVHCHNLYPSLSPSVLQVAHAEAVPTVMTLHNYRLFCIAGTCLRDGQICTSCLSSSRANAVIHRCYRGSTLGSAALVTSLALHRATGSFASVRLYLAVSEFVRTKHIEAGLSKERIVVKPNFSWALPQREGPGEYFLVLGRLAREKGIHTIIDAARDTSIPIVIVGDGPEAARLARTASQNVEFRGLLRPGEIAGMFRRARALVVPSVWFEASPRAIAEAYSAGIPAIASNVGGLPEFVEPGITGHLVRPHDVDGWTAALEQLMDDSESIRLGQGAHEAWSRDHSPDTALRRLEAAYSLVRSGDGEEATDHRWPGEGPS